MKTAVDDDSMLIMETPLPLEDTKEDVIAKALRAHSLRDTHLPANSKEYRTFVQDKLHLDPDALQGLANYHPKVILPDGVHQFSFPFFSSGLNIWTLRYSDGVVIIDTGNRRDHLAYVLKTEELHSGHPPLAVLITHGHRDHIGGLPACPFCPIICAGTENISCNPAQVFDFNIAGRAWKIHRLSGHSDDSLAFSTCYNGKTLFFTGDAVFAGSLGSIKNPRQYQVYFDVLLSSLRSLPDDALLLPGHGPATTMDQEWNHNPFLKGKRDCPGEY